MGKRELVIALAFVIVGAVAYQITAPPPKPGEARFSFGGFMDKARRGMRANSAQATHRATGVIPLTAEHRELRLESEVTGRGRMRVVGEARADIGYELNVQSTGPDAAAALDYAKRVTVRVDDLGTGLTLRLDYPQEGRQSADVTVRVPVRLAVLISGWSGVDVSNVASLHFDNIIGDCTVATVAGVFAGVHRNGSLTATDVGSVKMNLQQSRASFERVAGSVTLDVRQGEGRVTGARGPVEVDETRAEITVTNPAGPVRIGGSEGRVLLVNPRAESKVDVRRAEVEVQVSASVPLTLFTTGDALRLVLDGPPRLAIDAVTHDGKIQSTDFGLTPEIKEQESRLSHTFGAAGAPRVSLRNSEGDIIIRNSRGVIVDPPRK